jgi:hypothetical protein
MAQAEALTKEIAKQKNRAWTLLGRSGGRKYAQLCLLGRAPFKIVPDCTQPI